MILSQSIRVISNSGVEASFEFTEDKAGIAIILNGANKGGQFYVREDGLCGDIEWFHTHNLRSIHTGREYIISHGKYDDNIVINSLAYCTAKRKRKWKTVSGAIRAVLNELDKIGKVI